MDDDASLQLPSDLKARLDAAGVTDAASLQAALERDPQLRAAFQLFLDANREHFAAAALSALLAAFAKTQNPQQLAELWQAVLTELEQPFLNKVEQRIAQAERAGDADTVRQLRERLDQLRQLIAAQEAYAQLSPTERALVEFLDAPDQAAARAVFEKHRALLQPYEAQRTLDALFQTGSPESEQHIAERRALLRELRGAAPHPTPSPASAPTPTPAPPPSVPSDHRTAQPGSGGVNISGGNVYIARDLVGGDVIIHGDQRITNITQYVFESVWNPPPPPALPRVIPRPERMAEVLNLLATHDAVAIGGRAVAVQGMAGIGKTILCQILAHHVYEHKPDFPEYADGVVWTELGPERRTREQAQAVLNEWAGYCLRGRLEGLNFTPNLVRQLWAQHPNLLVILDNVWALDIVAPLREALPPQARLLLTTRLRDVMFGLEGARYELDKLGSAEAYALVKLRLGWAPDSDADKEWLQELFQTLDYHALALDVALGLLRRLSQRCIWTRVRAAGAARRRTREKCRTFARL